MLSALRLVEGQEGIPRDWMHPWLIKAKEGFNDWCKQPQTARARRQGDDDQIELIPVNEFTGGPSGFTIKDNQDVAINTSHGEMYLPIHQPCFELAKVFSQYQSKFDIDFRDFQSDSGGIPSSVAHLYEIWMKRALMVKPGNAGPLHGPILEPNNYFGAFVTHDLFEYTTKSYADKLLQEQDPSSCPKEAFRAIISNLETIDVNNREPEPEMVELLARIEKLPAELQLRIIEALEPFDDLGPAQLECTRVFPPFWWKQKLFSGDLFPWLFDLDIETLKDAEKAVGIRGPKGITNDNLDNMFDWELACRKLAQPNVFEPGGALEGFKSLENRHRIWRILDSARLGHLIY